MGKDLAWMLALEGLGEQYPINNPYFFDEALYNARLGWHSTSFNYAIKSGIPAEHLRSVYELIFG